MSGNLKQVIDFPKLVTINKFRKNHFQLYMNFSEYGGHAVRVIGWGRRLIFELFNRLIYRRREWFV